MKFLENIEWRSFYKNQLDLLALAGKYVKWTSKKQSRFPGNWINRMLLKDVENYSIIQKIGKEKSLFIFAVIR